MRLRTVLLSMCLATRTVATPSEPLPAALSAPLDEVATDIAPDPNDPIALLYGRSLAFVNGMPAVTVRILEGRTSFVFTPRSPIKVTTRGPVVVTAQGPRGGRWTARLVRPRPGRSIARVQAGEHLFNDSAGAEQDAKFFQDRGYRTLLVSVGTVYGIAGRAVDTRRVLVLLEADGTVAGATRLAAEIAQKFGGRPEIHREPVARAHATVEVVAPSGDVVARSQDALTIEVEGDAGLTVERVEHDVGYPAHGFENRTYKGKIYAVVDPSGKLAAVNLVGLEELTKGIVPSEIFASGHPEALKAQAVTARGEILAKVGARHVADPYLLCAEQHCQVFRGASGEDGRTTKAVEATRAEALFAPGGGPLVPSYYSAVCGGHTEDNDAVWGGPPDASIRGRPDFPVDATTEAFGDGIGDAFLRRWLEADIPAYCRTATVARKDKFRWKHTFTQAQVDQFAAAYKVGRVESLEIEGRGISGRAKTLVMKGSRGEARIYGELSIRRLFRMLESGMFVIDVETAREGHVWTLTGGGWGHGAGMCQAGAIGRAEKGQSYREILRHYFSGAEVVRMYE